MGYFSKKSLVFRSLFVLLCAAIGPVALFALPVLAYSPTLSITPENVAANSISSSVLISVYGQSDAPIQLYYYPTSYNTTYPYESSPYGNGTSAILAGTLGTTPASGYFSITISSNAYTISAGAEVYAVVGGQQSNVVPWPNVGTYTSAPSTYPQEYPSSPYQTQGPLLPVAPVETGVVSVGIGQNITIYAQSGGSYTITSNSNSEVVSASANGTSISLYGNEIGSALVTVCPVYYTYGASPCAAITVNVTQAISFSQSTVTLYGVGSSQVVTINGGYGLNAYQTPACTVYPYSNPYVNNYGNCNQYYIAGNTNSGAVSASISGNSLYISAVGYGGSTITVCQASGSTCGTVYVSADGATNNYYSGYNSNYYPYQQQNTYVYSQPVYTTPPVYITPQPIYGMRGWMRRW